MSKIELDFNELKYNLYEILNVKPDCDETKIRKAFIKLIKTFHPDKNSKLEEEIYYHLILSNQILLNKETRIKYDVYLESRIDTFNELKDSFNKVNMSKPKQEHKGNMDEFKQKVSQLDKKHGVDCHFDYNTPTIERYNNVKSKRGGEVQIDKENIKDIKDFNKKFTDYKINGKLKDQIVEYDKNCEIVTADAPNYVELHNIDKLYMEGPATTSMYSSLDRAFALQSVSTLNNTKTVKEKLDDYKLDTKKYSNPLNKHLYDKKVNLDYKKI